MHARVQALRETRVLKPFSALLLAQIVGSGLGFVYWLVGARLLSTGTLGVASAAISTHTLLGTVAMLGLGTLLMGELKVAARHEVRPIITVALSTAALAGVVLAVVVVMVTPWLSHSLRLAFDDPLLVAMFVIGVAATAVGLVLDQCVLGLDRPHVQVWRNLIASGLRFPIAGVFIALGELSASMIVFSWTAGVCISLVAVWPSLRLPSGRVGGGRGFLHRVQAFWRPAMSHHMLNLALASGPLLVPFIAAMVLSSVANGEFAVAWLLATFIFLPPYLLATALFAVSAKGTRADFRESARHTLPAGLALSAALCVGTWLLGPFVLSLFGEGYVEHSKLTLDVLVLGGLWMVLKDHLVAYARVAERLLFASSLAVAGVALELVGAGVGGLVAGDQGLAIGWLLVLLLQAVVGVPIALRVLRQPSLTLTSKET